MGHAKLEGSALVNFAIPISTLTDQLPLEFIDRFPTIEYKFFNSKFESDRHDTIFHSSMALVQDDFYSIWESEKAFEFICRRNLRRFSLDIGPRYGTCDTVDGMYVGKSKRLSISEMLEMSFERLEFIRKGIPSTCELAIENLNFYPTDAYDDVCHAEFYNDACRKLGVGFVLDTGHAEVTDINLSCRRGEFVSKIDPALISEIQLSKIFDFGDRAKDGHDLPNQHEFTILQTALRKISRPIDVVVEYYREPAGLMQCYEQLFRSV